MDLMERLTINYLKKRKKTIMDIRFAPSVETDGTARDLFMDRMRKYSRWAIDNELMDSRSTVKAMDTIDFSHIADTPGKTDMPAISLDPDTHSMIDECWYLILPPFKKGVLRPNRNRYIVWEILEIDEEEHFYWVALTDYAYEDVWIMENLIVGMFQWINGDKPCQYKVDGDHMAYIIERNLKEYPKGWTPDDLLYFKEVVVPLLRAQEQKDGADLEDVLTHFVGSIMNTNIQLAKSKPRAAKGSGTKIKTQAGEVDRNPKPKVVRTLPSGVQIKSVKVPKPVSADTIRKYHLEAWKTRGHIRHYKDGRVTYVRESIHHRKCLQSDEKSIIPQTIIKVG